MDESEKRIVEQTIRQLGENAAAAAKEYAADKARLQDRIEAKDAEIARCREALEDIGVYGCGMLNQPAAINGPENDWLQSRISRMEYVARQALQDTDNASHD